MDSKYIDVDFYKSKIQHISKNEGPFHCYDHKPESESDEEIYTYIKDNTVVAESDSEITAQKTKNRKVPIVYSSDDSAE